MADTYRYETGETNPTAVAYKTGISLEVGDMVYTDDGDSNTVKPASNLTWVSLASNQTTFASKFLGICQQRYDSTQNPVGIGVKDGLARVATSGIFKMDCAAGSTFAPGDLVGPADSGASSLEDQKVVAVASKGLAIGRVERAVSSSSKVLVRIFSGRFGPLTN